jgi:hypothetical protein
LAATVARAATTMRRKTFFMAADLSGVVTDP